ncbi:uncharacterized protein BO87DRAFT_323024, partial [Aspergillus neoniger CBS 115656]
YFTSLLCPNNGDNILLFLLIPVISYYNIFILLPEHLLFIVRDSIKNITAVTESS